MISADGRYVDVHAKRRFCDAKDAAVFYEAAPWQTLPPRIQAAAAESLRGEWYPAWSTDDMRRAMQGRWDGGHNLLFVAVTVRGGNCDEEDFVGAVGVDTKHAACGTPLLSHLFTVPSRRGRGIGSGLLETAECHLRRLGNFPHVLLYCSESSKGYYAKRGFQQIDSCCTTASSSTTATATAAELMTTDDHCSDPLTTVAIMQKHVK